MSASMRRDDKTKSVIQLVDYQPKQPQSIHANTAPHPPTPMGNAIMTGLAVFCCVYVTCLLYGMG